MMQKANNSMMVGSSSWLEQFTEAFTVQAGEWISVSQLTREGGVPDQNQS
jgi:hypothetical protein